MDTIATDTQPEVAQPIAGTIKDSWGDPCPAATDESYPLQARCQCWAKITCADGTASWAHARSGLVQCESRA